MPGTATSSRSTRRRQWIRPACCFRAAFSGRAEMGLAGNDGFAVKVSADGAGFAEGCVIAPDGAVTLPTARCCPMEPRPLPGLRFAADTGTGIAPPRRGPLALVSGGQQRAALSSDGVAVDVPVTGAGAEPPATMQRRAVWTRMLQRGECSGWGVAQGAKPWHGRGGGERGGVVPGHTAQTRPRRTYAGCGGHGRGVCWRSSRAWRRPIPPALDGGRRTGGPRSWQRRGRGRHLAGLGADVTTRPPCSAPSRRSAGMPTGAAIERGTGANGEYVRFADGTQICTRTGLSAAKRHDSKRGAVSVCRGRAGHFRGFRRATDGQWEAWRTAMAGSLRTHPGVPPYRCGSCRPR